MEHKNFFVEDNEGNYLVLKYKDYGGLREKLTMQFYFKLKGFYVFFFTLVDEYEKLSRKCTWFAVKLTND